MTKSKDKRLQILAYYAHFYEVKEVNSPIALWVRCMSQIKATLSNVRMSYFGGLVGDAQ
jgi:hypothetical protein